MAALDLVIFLSKLGVHKLQNTILQTGFSSSLAKFSESVTEMFQDRRKPYKLYECSVNIYKLREY